MRYLWLMALSLFLTACGADVGVAAATSAKMQAEQAKQGKESMDKMKKDLDAAVKANEAKLKEAETGAEEK